MLALTQSLVRGFALRQFIEKNPERIADLVGVWYRILAGHLAGLGVGDLVDTKPGAIRALESSVAAAVGRARGQATANRGGRK